MSIGTLLAEYEQLLIQHDWYYEMSEDHRVWKKGRKERDELIKLSSAVDPDRSLWNKYAPDMYKTRKL